ncbi:MAG: thiamine pyrophosphate-binding protein [Vicinamibacterales bacterium]|mgnify:CR=1 FL=1
MSRARQAVRSGTPRWPSEIHRVLVDHDVRQIAYVPDAGHTTLIALCERDRRMTTVSLTTEEEGVAMLAGSWLGGVRGALLMQSSGIGNCVNMLSVTRECRFPFLALVTMRGEWGEANPWQVPMGQASVSVLAALGVLVHRVEGADEVAETVAAAAQLAFVSSRAVAVLLGQRLIGTKKFQ